MGPGGITREMKKRKVSTDNDPGPRLQRVNRYLEKNFPDFFAEARFQVGDDDYFLYARFGQYLARTIEQNRATRRSEEHTSELQSQSNLVCRLLLEKKNISKT